MGPHPKKKEIIPVQHHRNPSCGNLRRPHWTWPYASFVVERVPPGAPTRWEPKGTKSCLTCTLPELGCCVRGSPGTCGYSGRTGSRPAKSPCWGYSHEVDTDSDKDESIVATSGSEGSESASESEQNDPLRWPQMLNSMSACKPPIAAVGRDFNVKTTHERCGPFSLVVLSQRRGRVTTSSGPTLSETLSSKTLQVS